MKKLIYTLVFLSLAGLTNSQWVQMPNGLGANTNITALASGGNNIFAGTNDNGIYLSTNNGTSWAKTTMNNLYIRSLAVNGSSIFAGTNGNGVFLSTDNGSNWNQTPLGNYVVYALAISGGYISASTMVSGPGEMPGVYLSTNNGSNWVKKMINTSDYVCSFGVNGNYIFAGSVDEGIYLSTDKGIGWSKVGLNSRSVFCIAFRDNNVLAGTYNYGVYISSNNGTDWSQTALNNETIGSLAVSGTNIFAATATGVRRSTNDGSNWLLVNSGFNPFPGVGQLLAVNNYIFAGTPKAIWRLDISSPPTIPVLVSPENNSTEHLLSVNLVWRKTYSANEYNVVLASDSAFLNIVLDTLMTDTIKAIKNLSPAKDYFWKIRSRIISTWSPFSTKYTFRTCSPWFPMFSGITNNNANAFAVNGGYTFAGTTAGVFMTTNSGVNWSAANNGLTSLNVKALFSSGSSLFAGTENGGVFLSTNYGGFWIAVNNGLYGQSVTSFVKSGMSLYAGTSGGVYRTTNNGGNWTDAGLSYTDIKCMYLNGSTIYAGTGGGLYFTSNNGANWNSTFGAMNINTIAVSGTNLYIGTATGVFLSTNNGSNWVSNWLSNQCINTLAINGTVLFAGTESGGVFLSANNGSNWVERNQGFTSTPSVRSFLISGSNIFAGTFGQSVWRRDLTYVIGISRVSELVPKTYSLSQNYPNPFNPTTKIKFDLLKSDMVTMKVFDILGREITTLVNEQLKPGSYQVDWDGSNYASGVYFYSLTTGEFAKTMKMVLIK